MNIIQIVFIICAVVLVFRAAQIQLFTTSYREKARTTTLDKITLYPSRGLILDRNNELLVYNNPLYDLYAVFNNVDPDMDTSNFCSLLNIDKTYFINNLNKNWRSQQYSKSIPFPFLTKIPDTTYTTFQENLYKFPGFYPQLRSVRGYPHQSAAHILGYISEIDKIQLDSSTELYASGDYIGTSGLEKSYERFLRGEKGMSYVLKDNLGREVGPFDNGRLDSTATSGLDLISTIDFNLQLYGEQLMNNKLGSIVAIEPSSGEILSMISAPAYDPNMLVINRNRGKAFQHLLADSLKPFFNRSVMAKYPPGSIFKPVLALIAMQEGTLKPNQTIFCDGAYYYKGIPYGCHNHPTPYNVTLGIQHSCNSYFFQTFRDLIEKNGFNNAKSGLDILVEYLYEFGLGKRLLSDIPHESSGHVPTSDYYDKKYKKNRWRSTYIMSIGIGQGELELTTLQMANLAALIANQGYYFTPHIIKGSTNPSFEIDPRFRKKHYVRIDPVYFEPVVEGMERAVLSGTARNANIPGVRICGKTGTSQNPHGKDHSVFYAFAPRENPQIAVAVYVENAGFGNSFAAPIASLMIEKYLNKEINYRRKWLEEYILNSNLVNNP